MPQANSIFQNICPTVSKSMNIFKYFSVRKIKIMLSVLRVQYCDSAEHRVQWHFLLMWLMIEMRYAIILFWKRRDVLNWKKKLF